MPLELIGLTITGASVANYIFNSVITGTIVNIGSEPVAEKLADWVEARKRSQNHDIQKAMVSAFTTAVRHVYNDWNDQRKQAADLSWLDKTLESVGWHTPEEKKARLCYDDLIQHADAILFGDKPDAFNDQKIYDLLHLPPDDKAEASADAILDHKDAVQENFRGLIKPYIKSAPRSLRA